MTKKLTEEQIEERKEKQRQRVKMNYYKNIDKSREEGRKKYYKQREYMKAYYANNKEKYREYMKLYTIKNKDKIKQKREEWLKNNPNYLKQYRATQKYKDIIKRYQTSNKEKIYERIKNWRKNNPDKVKTYLENRKKKIEANPELAIKAREKYNLYMRERNRTLEGNFVARCRDRYKDAKKLNVPNRNDITMDTFWELFDKQKGICPLTGISLILIDPNTGEGYIMYQVDHIIPITHPDSFHGKDNLQLVFPHSNGVKSNSI